MSDENKPAADSTPDAVQSLDQQGMPWVEVKSPKSFMLPDDSGQKCYPLPESFVVGAPNDGVYSSYEAIPLSSVEKDKIVSLIVDSDSALQGHVLRLMAERDKALRDFATEKGIKETLLLSVDARGKRIASLSQSTAGLQGEVNQLRAEIKDRAKQGDSSLIAERDAARASVESLKIERQKLIGLRLDFENERDEARAESRRLEAEITYLHDEINKFATKIPEPEATRPDLGVLEEAEKIVQGARQAHYGPPERNFELVAHFWNEYLAQRLGERRPVLGPRDVALLMILMKVARDVGGQPKRDNLVDIAGYAGCADLIAQAAESAKVYDKLSAELLQCAERRGKTPLPGVDEKL